MRKIKLTYFDMDRSRGETIRLALSITDIEFEDNRINFQQFGEQRGTFPLGCVPVIEVDGETYTQSNAISRYIGKRGGLYPDDPWQAFLCDEVMDIIEDATNAMGKTMSLQGDALKEARENLAAGLFSQILQLLQKRLEAAGGEFFSANKLTLADLKVLEFLRILSSGFLEYVPTDLVEKNAPLLTKHLERVTNHPSIDAYYQKRKK